MHSVSEDTAKTFLISFLGGIFDQLLKQCQIVLKPARADTFMATEDSDDVYFRFGGAAIAAMLQVRYKKMKGSTCTNQD